jgi:hypothetical protein
MIPALSTASIKLGFGSWVETDSTMHVADQTRDDPRSGVTCEQDWYGNGTWSTGVIIRHNAGLFIETSARFLPNCRYIVENDVINFPEPQNGINLVSCDT